MLAALRGLRETGMVVRSVLRRLLVTIAVCICCEGRCLAQMANPAEPPTKSGQESGGKSVTPDNVLTGGMTREEKFARCMESWDAVTHMSKKQWQRACERSVKDYPGTLR
jgi:hypothetical protein